MTSKWKVERDFSPLAAGTSTGLSRKMGFQPVTPKPPPLGGRSIHSLILNLNPSPSSPPWGLTIKIKD